MQIANEQKRITESKAITYTVVLIGAIFIFLSAFSYISSADSLKESIQKALIYRAEDNADLIDKQISSFKTIIEGIAFRSKIQSMDWDIQKPVLIAEAKRLGIERFQVVTLQGNVHSTNGAVLNVAEREYFIKATQGITNITEPFRSKISGKVVIVCATPIKDENNRITGVLTATIEPHFMFNIIKNRKIETTGYGCIINHDGVFIAHPNSEFILSRSRIEEEIGENPKLDKVIKKITGGEKGFITYNFSGTVKCAAYAPIPNTSWVVIMSVPQKELFHEIEALKLKFMMLLLAGIIISIALYISLYGYIVKNKRVQELEVKSKEDDRLIRESKELDAIRTQFFANISHEFRTPINVILATVQLLELNSKRSEGEFSNITKHIRVMKQNCQRLLRLVNNLIDSTRIDAGFLELHLKNYNIVSVVEEITLSVAQFAENRGISLLFDTEAEEIITACDADKIERIMLNLLSNAIKFTNQGGSIIVSVSHKAGNVIISVKDTGIGIPPEKQEVVFERFKQVQQTLYRNNEGSGIGLSIVKSFVKMHQGDISVVSEIEQGSEFIIELPVMLLPETGEGTILDNSFVQYDKVEKINVEFSDIYTLD